MDKQVGIAEEINPAASQTGNNRIDRTYRAGEQLVNDADNNYRRDEIWSIGHHLHYFFCSLIFQIIKA